MAKKSTKDTLEIRFILNKIVSVLGYVIREFFHLLFRLFSFILDVFKSIWLGLSVFIISISLLIASISSGLWLMSNALGLTESEAFQTEREQNLTGLFEFWETEKKENKQYRAAKKEKVKIAERTEVSCNESSECQTPEEYLIQSNCPYESRCYEDQCVVVCPQI